MTGFCMSIWVWHWYDMVKEMRFLFFKYLLKPGYWKLTLFFYKYVQIHEYIYIYIYIYIHTCIYIIYIYITYDKSRRYDKVEVEDIFVNTCWWYQ